MPAYRDNPARPAGARLELDFAELPAASQDLLRSLSRAEDDPRKLARGTGFLAILATAAGVLLLLVPLSMSLVAFDLGKRWDSGQLTLVIAASAAAGLLLAGGVAALIRAATSPLGSFFYAHPFYLLDCAYRRVAAYPLASLADHDLTGQSVDLSFGDHDVRLTFDSSGEAASFLQRLLADARTARERRSDDETEGGPDLLPGRLRSGATKTPPSRPGAIPLAAAVLLGLAGRFVFPALHDEMLEAKMMDLCRAHSNACAAYLQTFPGSAHLDEADDLLFKGALTPERLAEYRSLLPNGRHRGEVDGRTDRTFEVALLHANEGHPSPREGERGGMGALVTTLEALREAKTHTLYLILRGGVDQSLLKSRDPLRFDRTRSVDPPAIYGLSAYDRTEAAKAVSQAFSGATKLEAITVKLLDEGAVLPSDAAAVLEAHYLIKPGQDVYTLKKTGKGPYQEIVAQWVLTFRWPAKDATPVDVELISRPGGVVSTFDADSTSVYSMMVLQDMTNLRAELQRALGAEPAKGD
jgi:hypothetical protein